MTNVKQTIVPAVPTIRELQVGDFVREYKRDLYMVVRTGSNTYNVVAISGSSRGTVKFSSSEDTLRGLARRLKDYGDMSLVEVSELDVKISSEVLY